MEELDGDSGLQDDRGNKYIINIIYIRRESIERYCIICSIQLIQKWWKALGVIGFGRIA